MSGPGTTRPAQCQNAERSMQAYVDRALSPAEVVAVEEHLATCVACARCYRLEAEVRSVVRQACDEPCPDSLRETLRRICDDCDCD
jgi:mycothiol system anti-sigma-R factor